MLLVWLIVLHRAAENPSQEVTRADKIPHRARVLVDKEFRIESEKRFIHSIRSIKEINKYGRIHVLS